MKEEYVETKIVCEEFVTLPAEERAIILDAALKTLSGYVAGDKGALFLSPAVDGKVGQQIYQNFIAIDFLARKYPNKIPERFLVKDKEGV